MEAPLVVLDTNAIIDMWLGRDGDHAVLLLGLAETKKIEITIPSFVLDEFRGAAIRAVADIGARCASVRQVAKEWARSAGLDLAAEALRSGAREGETRAEELRLAIDPLIDRVRNAAVVATHTQDVHLRGELRFLSGRPPDRPGDGIQDCRVFEAVLQIARDDAGFRRPQKVFATKNGDFDHPELHGELAVLDFVVRTDLGKLYGELR